MKESVKKVVTGVGIVGACALVSGGLYLLQSADGALVEVEKHAVVGQINPTLDTNTIEAGVTGNAHESKLPEDVTDNTSGDVLD